MKHPAHIPTYDEPLDQFTAINQLALEIAEHAHRRQVRKNSNLPYIVHPKAVADLVPISLRSIALLHDVLEDNPEEYPESKLRELFPDWVVDRVVMLSRKPGEEYVDFIMRIGRDDSAAAVKRADLTDNLKDLKSGSLRDKYLMALKMLDLLIDYPYRD